MNEQDIDKLARRLYMIDGHHKDTRWELARQGRKQPYQIRARVTLVETARVLHFNSSENILLGDALETLKGFPPTLLSYIADRARAGHMIDPLINYELTHGGQL